MFTGGKTIINFIGGFSVSRFIMSLPLSVSLHFQLFLLKKKVLFHY